MDSVEWGVADAAASTSSGRTVMKAPSARYSSMRSRSA
jgi:hypothetical protein